MPNASSSVRIGLICAIAAYTMWGVFPLFWRLLEAVPPLEVVCHRVIWSAVFLAIAIPILRWKSTAIGIELGGRSRAANLAISAVSPTASEIERGRDQGHVVATARPASRLWLISFLAAIVISINWLAFIWLVYHDRVLDASLGYYIAPLVNVALGVMVLGERLTRWQWLAIVIATCGVTTMSITAGRIPWMSLAMAGSFGIYGLLKKWAPMPALVGLLMENALLCGPSLIYLAALWASGEGAMGRLGWQTDALLVAGGIVTVPPLMFFALAVRRVSLSTIGILQYIGPTLQFLVGVWVMGEPFGLDRMIGFSLVWLGSLIYILGAHFAFRKRRRLLLAGPYSRRQSLG